MIQSTISNFAHSDSKEMVDAVSDSEELFDNISNLASKGSYSH